MIFFSPSCKSPKKIRGAFKIAAFTTNSTWLISAHNSLARSLSLSLTLCFRFSSSRLKNPRFSSDQLIAFINTFAALKATRHLEYPTLSRDLAVSRITGGSLVQEVSLMHFVRRYLVVNFGCRVVVL